jgi:hypothetical protein
MDAGKGSFIAFATAPGSVSADGSGRNGVYTEHLLKSLQQSDGDIDKVFRRTAAEVSKVTGGKQVPWVSSSLTGDFYFRAPAAAIDETKLKQLEKERADLAKALEEEQKTRNKDAEFVRAEMGKLRAELQKIREGVAAQPAATAAVPAATTTAASGPASGTAANRPAQAAAATPPPGSAPSPSTPESPATAARIPAPAASVPPRQQLAIAAPPFGAQAASPVAAREWKDAIDLLEKSRGQLTYSKSMALLLGVRADDEIELLVNSASALGVNGGGYIDYVNSWRRGTPTDATESALAGCSMRRTGTSCRVVMVNREFREAEFMEVARRLGRQPRDKVREAALKRIAQSVALGIGR